MGVCALNSGDVAIAPNRGDTVKLGILGGTFDPIHLGHLIIAEEARNRLDLEKIFFIPTGEPWMKMPRRISPAVHRVEMVHLAIASNPFFELSLIEVEREGPSYSVDTIAALRQQQFKAELYFILGQDSLADLLAWREPQRLVQMCYLAVAPRLGSPFNISALEKAIPGVSRRIIPVDTPLIDITSTDIRQRAGKGLSLRYLVPPAVERYILRHKLYAAGSLTSL